MQEIFHQQSKRLGTWCGSKYVHKSYLACPSDGSKARTSNPSDLCIPHGCDVLGDAGSGGGVTCGIDSFLQHTSISFGQVVTLLFISIWTGLLKISSIKAF